MGWSYYGVIGVIDGALVVSWWLWWWWWCSLGHTHMTDCDLSCMGIFQNVISSTTRGSKQTHNTLEESSYVVCRWRWEPPRYHHGCLSLMHQSLHTIPLFFCFVPHTLAVHTTQNDNNNYHDPNTPSNERVVTRILFIPTVFYHSTCLVDTWKTIGTVAWINLTISVRIPIHYICLQYAYWPTYLPTIRHGHVIYVVKCFVIPPPLPQDVMMPHTRFHFVCVCVVVVFFVFLFE
jgi:hypothetical protein